MRRTRFGLTLAAVLAAVLLVPAPASAGDVQREEFGRSLGTGWLVQGFSGEPVATTRGGKITIGEQTMVMLREEAGPSEWTGSAGRLTGWDLDFRMRLGADATRACLEEETGDLP